jgi:hypothetical protein
MKTATTLLAALLLAGASTFAAEKKAAPAAEKPLQLAPEPAPTDILIPENIPQNAKPQGSAIPQPSSLPSSSTRNPRTAPSKPSKTQIAEDEVKQRIQYRLAKNKAVRDPAVQAAWDAAETARTDLEKREALKRYYTLLNARIRKVDGSLSKVAIERQTAATRRLEQTRIDPTEPLDPDERSDRQRRE